MLYCTKCGCKLESGYNNCPVCGEAIENNMVFPNTGDGFTCPENEEGPVKKKDKRKIVIAIVTLVAVAVAATLGLKLFYEEKEKSAIEEVKGQDLYVVSSKYSELEGMATATGFQTIGDFLNADNFENSKWEASLNGDKSSVTFEGMTDAGEWKYKFVKGEDDYKYYPQSISVPNNEAEASDTIYEEVYSEKLADEVSAVKATRAAKEKMQLMLEGSSVAWALEDLMYMQGASSDGNSSSYQGEDEIENQMEVPINADETVHELQEDQIVCLVGNIQRSGNSFPEWILVLDTPIEIYDSVYDGTYIDINYLGLFDYADENGTEYCVYEGDYVNIKGRLLNYRGAGEFYLDSPTIL